MQSDYLIERYGLPLIIGLIFGVFTAVMAGTIIGEWIGTDIGLLSLAEINFLATRTGFVLVLVGSMLYLFLWFAGEDKIPLPGSIAWHGLELLITAVIGLVVVVYGLDSIMPWYRPDALTFVPLSLFAGLLVNWVIRFFVIRRLFSV